MRACRLLGLAVLLVALDAEARTTAAGAGVPHLKKPTWTTDLRKFDGAESWLGEGAYAAQRKIAFVSENEIVVMRDEPTFPPPVAARAYALEASSGRIVGQVDWMTNLWGYVFATADGRCVVNTHQGAVLYSSGLKDIVARAPRSVKTASPDGRVVAVWYRQDEPRHGVTEFLDARSLDSLGIRFLDRSVESIAGDRIARRGTDRVVIESPETTVGSFHTSCDARPDFISEDLLVTSLCGAVHLIRSDGTLVFSVPDSARLHFAAASRDGRRFVVREETLGTSHWFPLRAETFTVFDITAKAPIARVKVPAAPRGRDESHAGAVLSPDGTRLAILSGGAVRLYRLP